MSMKHISMIVLLGAVAAISHAPASAAGVCLNTYVQATTAVTALTSKVTALTATLGLTQNTVGSVCVTS